MSVCNEPQPGREERFRVGCGIPAGKVLLDEEAHRMARWIMKISSALPSPSSLATRLLVRARLTTTVWTRSHQSDRPVEDFGKDFEAD